ncbi:MAG: hypothetical protein WAO02_04585 [Verrucomicrobiia bacterium]
MKFKLMKSALLTGLLIGAGTMITQASSSFVTFSVDMSTNILLGTFVPGTDVVNVRGTFNAWAATETPLVQVGSSTVYTNTVDDTSDANGYPVLYIFNINGSTYETVESFNNRAARLPTTSGGSLVLPTPFFGDSGARVTNNITFQVDVSQQIQLGVFTNGISSVEVRGNYNSWTGGASPLTNNPSITVTNQFGLVSSNVWMGTFPVIGSPWSAQDFKYVIQPGTTWDSVSSSNADSGGNRFWTFNPDSDMVLPLVNFADAPFAPLCSVTFAVDMSAQAYYGNWDSTMPVALAGGFNNWSTGLPYMTNNPSDVNTNIYYETVVCGQGAIEQYKFTFQGPGGTVWESPAPPTLGGNRFFTVPQTASLTLPVVSFSDLSISDLLTTDTWVTFTVNMTNASQYPTGPAFNPGSDTVYLNGAWLGWLGWNPINLAAYQLTNNPIGSEVYSGQFLVPKGSPIPLLYKYGINALDNEAASGNNHQRSVRTTATGAYSFPIDTFGSQYVEPSFGELKAAPAPGGNIQLSWLGAPNVQVQTRTSLTSGAWIGHPETAGTVWSSGNNSVNGLVSVTNWPAGGGSLFFRLIQQ